MNFFVGFSSFIFIVLFISVTADPTPPSNQSQRAGRIVKKDAPPAHEPFKYAENHGIAIEADEEGVLHAAGEAQDGYESLYFDPASTPSSRVRRSLMI